MKFKTEDLRRATDTAIVECEVQHNQRQNAKRAEHDLRKSQWVEAYNPEWEKALPRIRKALHAGRPVTITDLAVKHDTYRDSVAVFGRDMPKDEPFVVPSDLRIMQNALRLITDAEVTTTALKTLGVSATMLRTVCDYARLDLAKQQAKERKTAEPAKTKAVPRRRAPAKKSETATVSALTIPRDRS